MSLDQFRRLKLLKRLEENRNGVFSKSQVKKKVSSNLSVTQNLRKINKNKKYMLQQERNTEIQRNNRMLYEKIMNHFKTVNERKESMKNFSNRHKWRKRKQKIQLINNEQQTSSLFKTETQMQKIKYSSRIQTMRSIIKDQTSKTLFLGTGQIDEIPLRIKILLTPNCYYLLARNNELSIQLQMSNEQYLRIHNKELGGNPCNIFKFLEISNQQVKFRQKPKPVRIPKLKTSV